MLALIRPNQGQVNLVAADGSVYPDTSATRVNFMYVPQGNTLLSGTVRENVLLGAPDCSDADVEQVLRTACADFVFDLPEGIHTRVGEHGYGLSEGQAQRISIARALLRPGNIWLFDEASSALDCDTTTKLINNILAEGKEKTIIFVTHDPRVMERCDSVIRLNEKEQQTVEP